MTTPAPNPTAPPAPDPELEALQREVAEIMAEPENATDVVQDVQQALTKLDTAAAELAQHVSQSPPAAEEPAPTDATVSAEDTRALHSILAESEPASETAAPDPELQTLLTTVTESIRMEAAVRPPVDRTPPGATAPPPAPMPESITDVDAQVAAEAEQAMLHDEPRAPAADPGPGVQPVAPAAAALAVVPQTPKPEPKPEPKPQSRAEPKPVVEQKPPTPGFFRTKVEEPLLRAIGAASKPLAGKPALIQASGLIAIHTLVLGAGLWVYTLYFRPAHATPLDHHTFDFAHSGLPQPDHEPGAAAHGAPKDDHAAPADGHGEKKKDDAPAAKKDDGHGAAAKPAEPKKSIIASSGDKYVVNEKLNRKPGDDKAKNDKAKKASGGGGGH
ncbi:MAG TPA: hypothetical protein VHN77_15905 [Phycisphaerales bacterium]|nr:hypothetical protein [Phycisphaerales bacterium]